MLQNMDLSFLNKQTSPGKDRSDAKISITHANEVHFEYSVGNKCNY